MSRASKAIGRERMIQSFVEAFKKELARDIGFDIRARIDRERRPIIRGAMLQAERQVYRDLSVAHGDCPGGPLDRSDIEVEEAGKGQKMFRCFEGKE